MPPSPPPAKMGVSDFGFTAGGIAVQRVTIGSGALTVSVLT